MTTAFALLFLALGALGFFAATFLPGLLAAWLTQRSSPAAAPEATSSLQVLIAAHNEEESIEDTLRSIERAFATTMELSPSIVVGLDHCNDRTEQIVNAFAQRSAFVVRCQPKEGAPGKWRMLVELALAARAEWIAFVDCGAVWDSALLTDALPHLRAPDVAAVAPSYMPQSAGWLERVNWRLEQALKHLETRSGGPISVHGATVLYRRTTLLRALEQLAGRDWLNDDLVIPSIIRLLDPSQRIVYLRCGDGSRSYVLDRGVKADLPVEFRRRRRMAHGSSEWLEMVVRRGGFRQPIFALLATRRVCRMLWGYWATLFLFSLVLGLTAAGGIAPAAWGALLAITIGAAIASNFVRRLLIAYLAALRTPWTLLQQMRKAPDQSVSWQ